MKTLTIDKNVLQCKYKKEDKDMSNIVSNADLEIARWEASLTEDDSIEANITDAEIDHWLETREIEPWEEEAKQRLLDNYKGSVIKTVDENGVVLYIASDNDNN